MLIIGLLYSLTTKVNMRNRKCYIIGGGLGSLASASFLVRDGGIRGEDVMVLEENGITGGSLDAQHIAADDGYVMRGFRMLEGRVYSCLFDLLASMPSLNAPGRTVLQEFNDFNERIQVHASARLIAAGKVISCFPFDLHWKDRLRTLWLLIRPEATFGDTTIQDYFSASFFASNFWIQFCTTFSFQPWHSLIELRRYCLRFYHASPLLGTMDCVQLTPSNEYETIILPLTQWLKEQRVNFTLDVKVVDLDFAHANGRTTVSRIHYIQDGASHQIEIDEDDLVFATLGSMTANSSLGSMDAAPRIGAGHKDASWLLWERISAKEPVLGTPSFFTGAVEKSQWVSFTLTLRDSAFVDLLNSLTRRKTGTEGIVTLTDSGWLLSFAVMPFPYFRNQPEHVSICWGYGLLPDRPGTYVKKRMLDCTGKEILTELCHLLRFEGALEHIVETSTCIPCWMPYVTSQFLPRSRASRPPVVPRNFANLALLGQYCEVADDIVFTMEYAVRSAQTAVYSRLGLDRKVTPIYKGYRDFGHICGMLRTVLTCGASVPGGPASARSRGLPPVVHGVETDHAH